MELEGNTILITGGATGIGFALTKSFVEQGNEVIICARSEENLRKVKQEVPELHTTRCDISREEERKRLHDWVVTSFPDINVLVNNAGIQRRIDFRKGTSDLLSQLNAEGADEIDINFKAPVYLSAHLIPDLLAREEAAIINISSGLCFIPMAVMPVYCATKAAVHSFSVSLRHQLKNTPIKVFEVIPPMVDTGLDKRSRNGRGHTDRGISPHEVARATMAGLQKNEFEVAMGMAQGLQARSRENFEQAFSGMNR